MAVSSAALLTQQFYEWEQKGRGWHKAQFSCDLEPPFAPFFGHFLPETDIIDDGKRLSFFQSLFSAPPTTTIQSVSQEEDIRAYPATSSTSFTIFAIPKHGKGSAERMEQLLIMLSYRSNTMSVELIGTPEEVVFQVTCRDYDSQYVETQVKAFFPEYGIHETYDDYVENLLRAELPLYTVDFGLSEECMRPLAMLSGDKECYTALYGILDRLTDSDCVIIQVLFSGVCNPWAEHFLHAVHDNDGKGSFFFDDPDMVKYAHEKVSRPLCAATIRAMTFADTLERAGTLLQHVCTALIHASKSSGNALMPLSDGTYTVHERMADMLLRESRRVGMLLNTKELCALAHFPFVPLTKNQHQRTTKAVPAALIDHDYCIGVNLHQGTECMVSLTTEQRLRHIHIIGATGTGKSTLLHALMMEDVRLGNGFMCLDPHGDLIEQLLDSIPEDRIQDAVLIDPSDNKFPIGFNILSAHSELEKELLASDLVALFRRFSTSWGDQMNSVFANAILAFLYNSKTGTLADLRRFLIEAPFRASVLSTITDPDLVYYWQHEYPLLKSSSIGSILTRLDSFLRPRTIRHMVCQRGSLDFASLIDSHKIILVKLSQGLLGAENSYLLGAFIVSKLQQVAMARQAQAKLSRIPFYCYIDEFHHFTTPSMSEILSGARKYRLGLVLAHQDMQQLQKYESDIASTLLSNAGTRICFRLGDTDAKRLQDGLASFTAEDLQNLSTGETIIRVNTTDGDCTMTVIPHDHQDARYKEAIIAHSRATYSNGIPPTTPPQPITVEEEKAIVPDYSEQVQSQKPTEPGIAAPTHEEPQKELREHRYLQIFIKKMAEDVGYKASVEVPTPDGHGQVDVLLEKDGAAIAVEISVSTTAEWELHNIQKCLAAGYEKVVVCSKDTAKLTRIEQLIKATVPEAQHSAIHLISPEQIPSILTTNKNTSPTETVIKGYRVKVKYGDTANRQEVLQSIIAAARKA
jgi:hypothetical protein